MYIDWRVRETRAPKVIVCFRKPKHQMGIRVPNLAAKVLLLRCHIAHRSRFRQRQFLLVIRGFDTVEHLSFGPPSHCQLCRFEGEWQMGPYRRWIEAKRKPLIGVQKLRVVERGHPRSLYNARPAVLAFDRSFVAVLSKD